MGGLGRGKLGSLFGVGVDVVGVCVSGGGGVVGEVNIHMYVCVCVGGEYM
jgi:hypothetical protein